MRQPGDKIGRFVIVALLGHGGMGEVYEAEDSLLGRRVALKLVTSGEGTEDARERMLREARSAALFDHPNAVLVLDAGVVDEGPAAGETFIALELVRGETVRTLLGKEPPPPTSRKLRWLVDAARALAAAHEKGLVHRDVKPDNLMVREDGVLKVLDFGIAKRLTRSIDPSAPTEAISNPVNTLTRAGTVLGTPRYASPEQLQGEELDARSDEYSWGVTAYEILSGKVPFDASDAISLIAQVLGKDPVPLGTLASDVPKAAAAAVMRAMSRDKDDRFDSIAAAADALEPFAEVRSGSAPIVPAPQGVAKKVAVGAGRTILWVATGIGLLVMGAIAIGALSGTLHFDLRSSASANASASASPYDVSSVTKLACSPATMADATPELARAVGVGACARLAVAIGVDWTPTPTEGDANATPVQVSARRGRPAQITVAVLGRSVTVEGKSLVDASRGAAAAVAKLLPLPPLDPSRRAIWGAETDADAREIETAWRRLVMDDVGDDPGPIRDLAERFPTNPWAQAMVAVTEPRGTARQKAAVAAALQQASKLPPAREKAMRGLMKVYASVDDRPEGLKLLRQAYGDDPNDPDVAGLYGAVAIMMDAMDEGLGVVDRVVEKSPGHAIVPLRNAVSGPRRFDRARNQEYLEKLLTVWPDDRGSVQAFATALALRDLDGAASALEFRAELNGKPDALDLEALTLRLLRGDLEGVRDAARRGLGAASPLTRMGAGPFVSAAYFLEGSTAEGHGTEAAEMSRLRDEGATSGWMRHLFADLRVRRRLGEPVARGLLDLAADPLTTRELALPSRILIAAEIALARPKSARAASLAALREAASTARPEDAASAMLALLPLERAVSGDAAAVKLWRASGADAGTRASVGLDAALALKAAGAPPEEVTGALDAATDPMRIDMLPIDFLFATIRLQAEKAAGTAVPAPKYLDALAPLVARAPAELRERAAALE